MVRGLVDVDALKDRMPCRNHHPRTALPEPSPTKHAFKCPTERLRGVLGDEQMRDAAQLLAHPIPDGTVLMVEDRGALLHVELKDVGGGQAEAEPDGDDAAGRRARDQVEVATDRVFEVLFEAGQKRSGEYAADAAAIERQDAEELAVARRVAVGSPTNSVPASRRPCSR
jgi:hypothetical protein